MDRPNPATIVKFTPFLSIAIVLLYVYCLSDLTTIIGAAFLYIICTLDITYTQTKEETYDFFNKKVICVSI